MSRIFLSHSSRDNAQAVGLRDWLIAHGWDDVFLDLDPVAGLAPGQRWREELQAAADRCEAVLFLISRNWMASPWCMSEFLLAKQLGKRLFPLLIDGATVSDLPNEIVADHQAVDLSGDPQGWERLKQGLQRAGLNAESFLFPKGRRPYPGFEPLTEDDAAIFFGREAQTLRVLDRLRLMRDGGAERLLVVLGASGAGKSSFLRAGLWPRLRRDDRNFWPLPTLRPERAVLTGKAGLYGSLEQAVNDRNLARSRELEALPRARGSLATYVEQEGSFVSIVAALRRAAGQRFAGVEVVLPTAVLVIDQAEELFNADGSAEADRFLSLLAATLQAEKGLIAVLAIRSDAFPRMQAEPRLAATARQTFDLPPMQEGSRRLVIEGPARLATPPLRLEPDLVEELLGASSGPDALPLLAFMLDRLTRQYGAQHRLTFEDYRNSGGLHGAIVAAVDAALAEAKRLSPDLVDPKTLSVRLRRTFIPHLAQVNDAGEFVRRIANVDALPLEVQPLVDALVEARILTRDRDEHGDLVVEVAHEALLREWPQLNAFLEADREFLTGKRQLADDLKSWRQAPPKRKRDALLSGLRLDRARQWLQDRPDQDLTTEERTFIGNSTRKAERTRMLFWGGGIAAAVAIVGLLGFSVFELRQEAIQAQNDAKEADLLTARAVAGETQAQTALRDAQAAKAQTSVQLAAEELNDKRPDDALSVALAGSVTSKKDAAPLPGLVTAVAKSVADLNFADTLREHTDAVLNVVLGQDGQTALTIGADGKAVSWRADHGQDLRPAASTGLAGQVVAVANDGSAVASASTTGDIEIWHLESPTASPRKLALGQVPMRLAFSLDNKRVAALGEGGRLAIWDLTQDGPPWVAPDAVPGAQVMAFGSDCACLVLGTLDGDLEVWANGRDRPTIIHGAKGRITGGVFSRTGQFVFITEDGRLWLTDTRDGSTPSHLGPSDGVSIGLAISPDGTTLASADNDGFVRTWNLTSRVQMKQIKPGSPATPTHVSFSPDGASLAIGLGDGGIELWDVAQTGPGANLLLFMSGHSKAISDLSFDPDGDWLASASLDHTARLWRIQTASRPRRAFAHHGATIHAVSDDGRSLISGGETDNTIQVWSGPVWRSTGSTALGSGPSAMAISSDGRRAFVGTNDGDLLPWTPGSSLGKPLSQDNGRVNSLAVSPDWRTLAAIGVHARLTICDIGAAKPICLENQLTGWGYSVAFSADGRWLGAGAGGDGRGDVYIRNLDTKETASLAGHTAAVSFIQFDPSGRRLLTASWDGTVRIWDLASKRELIRLVDAPGRLSTAGISPDGTLVATCTRDRILRLWTLTDPGDARQPLILASDKARILSDSANLSQIRYSADGHLLYGALENGDIQLWHLPDGGLRAVLHGDGSPIVAISVQANAGQVTASTSKGNLLTWAITPVLGLQDNALLTAARSIAALPGSLGGTSASSSPADRPPEKPACHYGDRRNMGLPPLRLSEAVRARSLDQVSHTCATVEPAATLAGFVEEAEGDFQTADQVFTAASARGETSAEIGLGDLGFVDDFDAVDRTAAESHYARARERGAIHAASRLGWLAMAGDDPDRITNARADFEAGTKSGDADAFAGLAWLDQRFGSSEQQIEAAFAYYIKAQAAYERDGDLELARQVAEQRASLARLIDPARVASLFLKTRSQCERSPNPR